jgi:hypothetical protein
MRPVPSVASPMFFALRLGQPRQTLASILGN